MDMHKLYADDDHPRPGFWHDLKRDWQGWTHFERIAAPLIMLVMLAASFRGLWFGV